MKKFTLFACLVAVHASAFVCDVYGNIEALYWRPVHCPIPFVRAERSTGTPDVAFQGTIRGHNDWGVRGTFGAARDCFFSDVAYHWVESSDHAFKAQGDFNTTFDIPANDDTLTSVTARLTTRYQGVDWRIGYRLPICAASLSFFADIRWIDQRLYCDARGLTAEDDALRSVTLVTEYDAGGVGLGFEGSFPICWGFGFMTRASATALVGDSRIPYFVVNGGGEELFLPRSVTTVHPLFDIRVALTFEREFCGLLWSAHFGYELDYVSEALQFWTTTQGDQLQGTGGQDFPITGCNDFGYGGIFFGIGVEF